MKTMTLSNGETTHRIDVSSIASGVYVVSLENNLQEKTEKVIIK
jgi:hypothetical protein